MRIWVTCVYGHSQAKKKEKAAKMLHLCAKKCRKKNICKKRMEFKLLYELFSVFFLQAVFIVMKLALEYKAILYAFNLH